MSIEKQTTSAIVTAAYDSGEHDVMLKIYARDFGMIYALSKGLKRSAKLRSHLMLGRVADITLVKGKEVYRVVGARESMSDKSPNIKFFINIINRLVHGEIKNIRLYNRILKYAQIENVDVLTLKLAVSAELLIVLGYIDTNKIGIKIEDYIKMEVGDFLLTVQLKKKEVALLVKSGLEDSML